MDIKSLIGYINRDIRDIGELTASFSGYDKIPQFDMDLTLSKIKTIAEELEMLDKLNSGIAVSVNKQVLNEKEEVKSNGVPPELSKIQTGQVNPANSTLTMTNQVTTKQVEVPVKEKPQPLIVTEPDTESLQQLTETLKNKKKSHLLRPLKLLIKRQIFSMLLKRLRKSLMINIKKKKFLIKSPWVTV